jgi:ankyrin repeat protein
LAAPNGHTETAAFLIAKGADLNAKDNLGFASVK